MEKSVVLNAEVKLTVCDEGGVWLSLPDKWYKLSDRCVTYIADRGFLVLCASEDTDLNLLYPINPSECATVRDFMTYWGKDRLLEVNNKKWNGFTNYLNHVLGFIKENINVERLKPKYRTLYHDHRGYGGDEANNIEILVSWGESWRDDFDKCWALTERLVGEQIGRSFDGEDENYWFSSVSVTFRPLASDTCDFVAFD